MAYRFEKNENKGYDLVVDGWENGIGDSALVGHQQMKNVDIFNFPGFLGCQYKSVKKSGSVVTALVYWIVTDPQNGAKYALDENGKVYKRSGGTWSVVAGNPTTGAGGNGLAIWKDTLFVARAAFLDAYYPLSGAPTWNPGTWGPQAITSTNEFHPMYTGPEDDSLYWGNIRFLGKLIENSGSTFDPGNNTTYTLSNNVLDLPQNYYIRCIEGLGLNLMLGTTLGSALNSVPVADIFPWDRASTTYSLPIRMGVNGVSSLKNVNNIVHVYAGNMVDISRTNGSSTALYKRFYNVNVGVGSFVEPFPMSIENLNNFETLIGISNDAGTGPYGVYSVRDGVSVLRNTLSTGTTSSVLVGAISAITRDEFCFSWKDGSSYGIDEVLSDAGYWDDWSSSVDADIIPVSTALYPREFSEIEFRLGKVLATGEGIRVYYRNALSESFTLVGQWTFADIGAKMSYQASANIVNTEFLQFRVQLLGTTGSSGTTPLLQEIRVR